MAEKIYFNGDIITMETDSPQYVEALVVDEGKIVFTGSLQEAKKTFDFKSEIDLKGKTLLPRFIDPHSHFSNVSDVMGQVNLNPPPVGEITNIPQLLEKIKKYKIENNIPEGEWTFAAGYDDKQLAEKRHPNRKEIDEVLPNNAVYLAHTSGQMGVANSLALKLLNLNAQTPNPEGGNIDRYPNTNETNASRGVI